MKGHLDAPTVAAYSEGLLRRRQRSRIASHLSSCPRCTELGDQLAGVSSLLARTPTPAMPATLAARLEAAIAAEAAARAVAPGARPAEELGAAPAARPSSRHRRGARTAPARVSRLGAAQRVVTAAAALALIGGGGYAVSQAVGNESGPRAAGVTASAAHGTAGVRRPGQPAAGPGMGQTRIANGPAVFPVVASGVDYRPATFQAQVASSLGRKYPEYGRVASSPLAGGRPSAAPAASGVIGCATRLAAGRRILMIDVARYGGRPAAIIVATDGPRRLAWAVPASCSATAIRVLARAELPARA